MSATSGRIEFKAGVQYDRSPVVEHFRMTGLDAPFASTAPRPGRTSACSFRTTLQPVADLHINVGLRYDYYKLLIEDTRAQPAGRRRLSRARFGHGDARVLQPHLHAAFFGEPAASRARAEARALSPNAER